MRKLAWLQNAKKDQVLHRLRQFEGRILAQKGFTKAEYQAVVAHYRVTDGNHENMWNIPLETRWRMYQTWAAQYKEKTLAMIKWVRLKRR